MTSQFSRLAAQPGFAETAAALASLVPREKIPSLDETLEHLRAFAAIRRREARISRLERAERESAADWRASREKIPAALQSFAAAMSSLAAAAKALEPLITTRLDAVIALAADEAHPLYLFLYDKALEIGFSPEEAQWIFAELGKVGFRPVELICGDGCADFEALLAAVAVGETGLLQAGFVRQTGVAEIDNRLAAMVVRLREKGVTANVFLALTIVLVARVVAAQTVTA